MPVTLRGKKSYIVNPQLSSVLSSLQVIQKTINSARPEWWKCSSYSQTMMSQHFAGGSPDVPSNSYATGAAREESSCDEEDKDKGVSFNFERNVEKYSDKDEDDEDSDATTLGDEKDADSFLTPILKRRKRNDTHRTAQFVEQNMDKNGKSGECQQKSGKDSTLGSDVNPASGNVLGSHTPQSDNLNKSCLLPDVSFHASPIAKESSQVESQSQLLCQSPFMKKTMDGLKEGVAESSSLMDGTTEEYDNDKNDAESDRYENTSKKLTSAEDVQNDIPRGSYEADSKLNAQERIKNNGNTSSVPQQTVQMKPAIPKVFLLSPSSSLTSADQRILRKLIKKERLKILHPHSSRDVNNGLEFCFDFDSDHHHVDCFLQSLYTKDDTLHYPVEYSYAICSNAEYQMFEGYIMPRSFQYILAVACGLSIIDFSYLRQAANRASFGIHNSQKYLYAPGTFKEEYVAEDISSHSRRKRSRGNDCDEREVNYQIAGDIDSLEIMGPQRSREVMLQRLRNLDHKDFSYNNGLLDGYHVILYGDFDDPVSLRSFGGYQKEENGAGRKGIKQTKKNAATVATDNCYTKGRVRMLLQLCGAKVCDEAMNNVQISTQSKVVILTRCGAKVTDCLKCILDAGYHPKEPIESAPIVGLRWLQDTIAEFKIKHIHDYANGGTSCT